MTVTVGENFLRKTYNYLLNSKSGRIIEPIGALILILTNYNQSIIFDRKYRRAKKNLKFKVNEKVVIVVCRSYLWKTPNGVKNWLESIALNFAKNENYKVVILTQNSLIFRYLRDYRNIQIFSIPVVRNLRFEKITYAKAWSKSVFNFVIKNGLDHKDVYVIGTISGLEMMSLDILKNAKPVVLLVTPRGFDRQVEFETKDFQSMSSRSRTIFLAEKNICQLERVIVISDSTGLLKDLELYYDINLSSKVHVVHIGHILEDCQVEESYKSLLYFGPLRWRKGADILPALLQKIKENFPDWSLTVATSGGELTEVSEQLAQMNQLGLVNLTMKPDEQTRHDLMRNATLLLIPSRYESFGMVATEGMAHGVFILSTNIGGISEVVLADGVLSNQVTPEAFFQAFIKASENSNHSLEKRYQRAMDARERFSPDRMMYELEVAMGIKST